MDGIPWLLSLGLMICKKPSIAGGQITMICGSPWMTPPMNVSPWAVIAIDGRISPWMKRVPPCVGKNPPCVIREKYNI